MVIMAHFGQSITKLQIPLRSVAASRSFFLTDDIVTWHPLTLPWGDRAITSQLRLANPPPQKNTRFSLQEPLEGRETSLGCRIWNLSPTYLMLQPAQPGKHPEPCTKSCLESAAISWSLYFRYSGQHRKHGLKGMAYESDRFDSDIYKAMWP